MNGRMNPHRTSWPPHASRPPGARSLTCALGVALIAAALSSTSCKRSTPTATPPAPTAQQDPVALRIGERDVRLSELQSEIDFLRAKRHPSAAGIDAFLDPAIERRIALEKARELGLDQDFELKRQWENLLIGRLRETEIEAKLREATVTDEEIADHYQRNLETYARPAQLHLALLHLKVPAHADDAARQAIRTRLEEARALALELPADARGFGALAMNYSEEPTSRFKGGDIGWLEAGATASRWPEEVLAAAFALPEHGALSEVISASDGFYLVKKLDSRQAVVRALEGRLRAAVADSLLREKRTAIEAGLTRAWTESIGLTVHREVLDALDFQPTEGTGGDAEPFPPSP